MSNLILCGFKGAGKTTYGKQLASFMGLPFLDVDDRIAEKGGMSPRELYMKDGGITLRRYEKEVVKELQGTSNHVIALGGGTLVDPDNRAIILGLGQLLYLRVDKEVIRRRIDMIPGLNFDEIFEERREVFENLPAVVIDGK